MSNKFIVSFSKIYSFFSYSFIDYVKRKNSPFLLKEEKTKNCMESYFYWNRFCKKRENFNQYSITNICNCIAFVIKLCKNLSKIWFFLNFNINTKFYYKIHVLCINCCNDNKIFDFMSCNFWILGSLKVISKTTLEYKFSKIKFYIKFIAITSSMIQIYEFISKIDLNFLKIQSKENWNLKFYVYSV